MHFWVTIGLFLSLCYIADGNNLNGYQLLSRQSQKSPNGVISLGSEDFIKILNSPRNYSVAVLFNIIHSEYPCIECINIDQYFRKLSDSWKKASSKSPNESTSLFFVNIDYADGGKEAFTRMNIRSPPHFVLLEETSKSSHSINVIKHTQLDLYSMHYMITKTLNISFPLPSSFSLFKLILTLLFLTSIGLIIYFYQKKIQKIVCHQYFWKLTIIPMVIIFTSGHLWNSIRSPNFVTQDGKHIKVFIGQLMNQNGIESQIITALIAISTISLITLVNTTDDVKAGSERKSSIIIGVALAFFIVSYGSAFLCFQTKGMGYPFNFFY